MHTLPHTPLFVIVVSAWVRGNRGCVIFWVLFFPSPRQPTALDTYHLMPYTNAGFNNIQRNMKLDTSAKVNSCYDEATVRTLSHTPCLYELPLSWLYKKEDPQDDTCGQTQQ